MAVTWLSNTWLLKENSAQVLACVSLCRDSGIKLFSHREVLLCRTLFMWMSLVPPAQAGDFEAHVITSQTFLRAVS